MNRFIRWYISNYSPITWFLIGFLIAAALQDLSKGDYTGALISFGIAVVNYIFVRNHNS
jgi:positive regulator of sigma E activity